MNEIKISQANRNSKTNDLRAFSTKFEHSAHHSFVKQQIHEKHIDEFFLTDVEAPPKRHSNLALIGSLVGVLVPTVLFAKKQNPELKLASLKGLKKAINIKYGLKEILSVGLGGVYGGLIGGLSDKQEKDKLQKLEEASFQTMNIAFPAILVDKSMKLCSKTKGLNNPAAKIFFTALSIFAGAGSAVAIANKVDDKFFDKYSKDPTRRFKHKDLLIHVDDLLGSLVLARAPFIDKLHVNKILPVIYAWAGYQVGDC